MLKKLYTCSYVEDFDIIMIYQTITVSVCSLVHDKSLDWDLRMRVMHDIIACYSEVYFSMLFSRFESDTLISQFSTFSNWRFDNNNYRICKRKINYWATVMIISYDNDSLIFDMHKYDKNDFQILSFLLSPKYQ